MNQQPPKAEKIPAPGQTHPEEEMPAPAARLVSFIRRPAKPTPRPEPSPAVERLSFCHHPLCSRGAPALRAEVNRLADEMGLELELVTTLTVCDGGCRKGPWVGMPGKGLFYQGLTAPRASLLLEETVRRGRMLFEHLYLNPTKVTHSRVVWEPSQGLIVAIEPEMCPLDIAAYLFFFNAAQSCGKCTPCRLGVPQVARLLNDLRLGQAAGGDVGKLSEIVELMAEAAHCAFAPKVSEPLRVGLAAMRHEFERHEHSLCSRRHLTGDERLPDDPPAERGPWASREGLDLTFQASTQCAMDPFCSRPPPPPGRSQPGGDS